MPEGMQENSHLAQNPNLHRPSPGERERVATLSHPVTRGGVGERSAPRSCRRKRNPHPNSPSRCRKPASPPKHFPASSEIQIPAEPSPGERERVATLSHPVTRGGVGEQSAPRPRRRKRNPHPNSPSRRRKPASPPKLFPASSETEIPAEAVPGRAREGRTPLAPRRPRGCRGAERPTPVPPETKSSSEQPFAPPKTSISTEAISCIVGNPNSRRIIPGRAREGRNPLAPRRPRGCRGAERPTPVSSETTSSKGQPASSETNIPTRTPPRESARGCEHSRLPIEAGDLRGGKVACPKGKQVASRPTKRNRRFRLVAPGR